jgi:hypothetical protein
MTITLPAGSSRRLASGAIARSVSMLLTPARLLAQACSSQALPSSSHSGVGSMMPLPGSSSCGSLHGPAKFVAVVT